MYQTLRNWKEDKHQRSILSYTNCFLGKRRHKIHHPFLYITGPTDDVANVAMRNALQIEDEQRPTQNRSADQAASTTIQQQRTWTVQAETNNKARYINTVAACQTHYYIPETFSCCIADTKRSQISTHGTKLAM